MELLELDSIIVGLAEGDGVDDCAPNGAENCDVMHTMIYSKGYNFTLHYVSINM